MGSAGDDAPLEVMTRLLRNRLNEKVHFTVLARHQNKQFEKDYRVKLVRNFEYDTKKQSAGRWLKGFNPDDSITEIERILDLYSRANLLILGAGNFINEHCRGLLRGLLPRFYLNAWLASWVDLPVMLYGLSSSPIKSMYARYGAQWLLKNADAVVFREEFAPKNLLTSNIKLPDYKILPDPVIGMRKLPINEELHLYKKENIPLISNERLAISVRYMGYLGEKKEKEYYLMVARLTETWLSNHPDGDVIFIPQFVYDVDGPIDDIGIADRIISLIQKRFHPRIFSVKGKYLPWETEAFYRKTTIALTTRLHATLFALRSGIPTIAIGYETKVKGLLKRLQYPQKFILEVNSSPDTIFQKINTISHSFNDVKHKIAANIKECQQEIEEYADVALNTMK